MKNLQFEKLQNAKRLSKTRKKKLMRVIKQVLGLTFSTSGLVLIIGSVGSSDYSTIYNKAQSLSLGGYTQLILIGAILITAGVKTYLSSTPMENDEIGEEFEDIAIGAITYLYDYESYVSVVRFHSETDWSFVLCDYYGRPMSSPIKTHRNFFNLKWNFNTNVTETGVTTV